MFKRSFLANLIAVIVLIIILAILFFTLLGVITRHGKTLRVPKVTGQQGAEASRLLGSLDFNVVVQDSAYTDTAAPLTVLRQTPEAGFVVKVGRTVYLTLNKKMPPTTAMPDLVNYSFRSAMMTLESQRLNLGDTLYRPDIAKDAVLQQLYNGKPIAPGTLVPEGARITLVLGDGIGNVDNPVPNLVGLTYLQALDLLSASNLNRGVVLTDGVLTDTANAHVFRQNPSARSASGAPHYIRAGESIDLWISQDSTAAGIPPADSSAL
ncbi:PASTA domain-containing protein [Compostibacter hankyongensis]|uniref:PASTA domain-containing protein n=1 Tax=Compostibacter hankyongensis TaxID=1007089 RepID=UPI0031E6BC15